MAENEIVYVAVIPLDNPGIDLVKAVAGIIGKDAYQTRLLLAGSIPRIVARCNGAGAAEAMGRKLMREAGLTTIVCSDAELRQPFQGQRVQTLEFGDGDVTFRHGDEGFMLEVGSVFLIIKGTRHPAPVAEEDAPVKTKMKLDVGKTLLMGGIPVMKRAKAKLKAVTPENEWFLRFYERRSSEPRVEILQYDLDYSFLGEETAMSSVANFINVVKRLREIYPQAIYDERLMKTFAVDIPMTTSDEDIDINCRLIYFQHLP
jgi:hypothetical protein